MPAAWDPPRSYAWIKRCSASSVVRGRDQSISVSVLLIWDGGIGCDGAKTVSRSRERVLIIRSNPVVDADIAHGNFNASANVAKRAANTAGVGSSARIGISASS